MPRCIDMGGPPNGGGPRKGGGPPLPGGGGGGPRGGGPENLPGGGGGPAGGLGPLNVVPAISSMPPPPLPAVSPAPGGMVGTSPRIPSFGRPAGTASGSGLMAVAGGNGGRTFVPGALGAVGGGTLMLVGGRPATGGGPRRDTSAGGAATPGSVFISGTLTDLLESGGGPRMPEVSGGRTSREVTDGLMSSCGPHREFLFDWSSRR